MAYNNPNQDVSYMSNTRTSDKVMDQAREIENISQMIGKMDIILNAMFELFQETGVEKQRIYDKIDEIIQRRNDNPYGVEFRICPKCGHKITEARTTPMRGNCLFCGEKANFYPYDEEARKQAEAEEYAQLNPPDEPYDLVKNLNLE